MEWRPTTCQYIGPDQDPRKHFPIHYCGQAVVPGKSYCGEHYAKMYIAGSAVTGKRKAKQLEAEIREAELARLVEEQSSDDMGDVKEDIYVE